MMYQSSEFISSRLPRIIARRRGDIPTRVLFATGREIWEVHTDTIYADRPNLRVDIQRGRDAYDVPPAQRYDVVVVYFGLTDFDRAFAFAQRIACARPGTRIVAVICDCSVEERHPELRGAVEAGTIEAIVRTPHCGGQLDLRQILDGILQLTQVTG